jgi:hypothetical protein
MLSCNKARKLWMHRSLRALATPAHALLFFMYAQASSTKPKKGKTEKDESAPADKTKAASSSKHQPQQENSHQDGRSASRHDARGAESARESGASARAVDEHKSAKKPHDDDGDGDGARLETRETRRTDGKSTKEAKAPSTAKKEDSRSLPDVGSTRKKLDMKHQQSDGADGKSKEADTKASKAAAAAPKSAVTPSGHKDSGKGGRTPAERGRGDSDKQEAAGKKRKREDDEDDEDDVTDDADQTQTPTSSVLPMRSCKICKKRVVGCRHIGFKRIRALDGSMLVVKPRMVAEPDADGNVTVLDEFMRGDGGAASGGSSKKSDKDTADGEPAPSKDSASELNVAMLAQSD